MIELIIPYHGQYEAVMRCVESVIRSTPNGRKIILVDDASPNKSFGDELRGMNKCLTVVRRDEHGGFAAAVNSGISVSSAPLLYFMHSDCRVHDLHWFKNMASCLSSLKGDGVKLVCSRVSAPGYNCLEQDGLYGDFKDRLAKPVVAKQPLPLIAWCCHRELFARIGPLAEYKYGFFEDEEFYWRMKSEGYRQAICTDAWLIHDGGLTVGNLLRNDKVAKVMADNEKICFEQIKKYAKPGFNT